MANKLTVEFDLGELKISGLKIRVTGERDEAASVVRALTHQVIDSVRPALNAPLTGSSNGDSQAIQIELPRNERRNGRRRSPKITPGAPTGQETSISFRHDAAQYGNPLQAWKVVDKCIWMLYVLDQLAGNKEVSTADLTNTYNKQFKTAGLLYAKHVPRELGRAKTKNPCYVGEDSGQWFLTDAGKQRAKELINEALSPSQ